jgi:hypothetical protein
MAILPPGTSTTTNPWPYPGPPPWSNSFLPNATPSAPLPPASIDNDPNSIWFQSILDHFFGPGTITPETISNPQITSGFAALFTDFSERSALVLVGIVLLGVGGLGMMYRSKWQPTVYTQAASSGARAIKNTIKGGK